MGGTPGVLLVAASEDGAAFLRAEIAAADGSIEARYVEAGAGASRDWPARERVLAVAVDARHLPLPPSMLPASGEEAPPLVLMAAAPSPALAGIALAAGAAVHVAGQGRDALAAWLSRARSLADAARRRDRRAAFDAAQRAILEGMAEGSSLPEVLERIVRLVEGQGEGFACSLLLLDAAQGRVRHGAAPSLPGEYNRAIDGAAIGPEAGSCGAAAYRAERVVVEDIYTHPYWAAYKHLALPHGLRACWSSPIFSPSREVLGTFAIYYREPRGPTPDEVAWVDAATHLAAVAILRERDERALRDGEAERRVLFDNVSDVIFDIAVEPGAPRRFRFVAVNPAFLRATGLTEAQVVGRRVHEIVPEPSCSQVVANYERAIESRATVRWDEVTPYPAGLKHGEVAVTPVFDDEGRCTNLVGTVRDLTERLEAQARIAAQAALLDRASDAILLRGAEDGGIVRYWNQGAAKLYGYAAAEAMGRRIVDLVYADEAEYERAQRRLLRDGAWTGELRQRTKDGRPLTIRASWTLERDASGRPHQVFAINTDVTETKRLQGQVMLAQRMESLGTLAGGIAHDFNNILTAIIGNVELALKHLPPEGVARERLEVVRGACARATGLVGQILTFSRRREPRRSLVHLRPIVDETVKLLRATMPERIVVRSDLAAEGLPVVADPSQIHQVVMNLGTNAAQALGAAAGSLEFRLDQVCVEHQDAELSPGTYMRLSVSDTGAGIDEATMARIFEPFFTTKGPGRGTGLGLSVVHGIVKSHEGAVSVDSAPGRGTTFVVHLPVAEGPREGGPGEAEAAAGEAWRGRGEHVIYVDGEESVVALVTAMLEGLGYRASGFADPGAALRAMAAAPSTVDAVAVGHQVAGRSGANLAADVRRVLPTAPVVVIVDRADHAEREAMLRAGAVAVLDRESLARDLPRELRRMLGRAPAP